MNSIETKNVIVVLGAGRSGTSLLMQVLASFDMRISHEMTAPRAHNELGPFEDAQITRIYNEFLDKTGLSRALPLPGELLKDGDLIDSFIRELSHLVKQNIQESDSIWGFKEPYTATVLPFWTRIFNRCAVVPRYLLTVRNPINATISRKRHFGTSESTGELQWLMQNCDAIWHSGGNFFIIQYEDWFSDARKISKELLEYVGIDQPVKDKDYDAVLATVIKPELQRSIYENYEPLNHWVKDLYSTLKDCRGTEFDRKQLMALVGDCRSVMNQFNGWIVETQRIVSGYRKKNLRLNQRLTSAKEKEDKYLNRINNLKNKKEIYALKEKIREIEKELTQTVTENNQYLQKIKDLHERAEAYRIRKLSKQKPRLKKNLYDQIAAVKASTSLRLGRIFIHSIKKPGKNTVLLPIRLISFPFQSKPNKAVLRQSIKMTDKKKLEEYLEALKNSESYRLGRILVSSVRKPGKNTLLLPFRLIKFGSTLFFSKNESCGQSQIQ